MSDHTHPEAANTALLDRDLICLWKGVIGKLFHVDADAATLYLFLNYHAKKQDTRQPWATPDFCRRGLKWGKPRFEKADRILRDLGLIEKVPHRDPATGKVDKWYVRIHYKLAADRPSDPDTSKCGYLDENGIKQGLSENGAPSKQAETVPEVAEIPPDTTETRDHSNQVPGSRPQMQLEEGSTPSEKEEKRETARADAGETAGETTAAPEKDSLSLSDFVGKFLDRWQYRTNVSAGVEKQHRANAIAILHKIPEAERPTVLRQLENWRQSPSCNDKGGGVRPHPDTWLNHHRQQYSAPPAGTAAAAEAKAGSPPSAPDRWAMRPGGYDGRDYYPRHDWIPSEGKRHIPFDRDAGTITEVMEGLSFATDKGRFFWHHKGGFYPIDDVRWETLKARARRGERNGQLRDGKQPHQAKAAGDVAAEIVGAIDAPFNVATPSSA